MRLKTPKTVVRASFGERTGGCRGPWCAFYAEGRCGLQCGCGHLVWAMSEEAAGAGIEGHWRYREQVALAEAIFRELEGEEP
jgi:hypothetical protein